MVRPWAKWAKLAVKVAVALAVSVAVGRHIARTVNDLRDSGQSLKVNWGWAAAGVGFYTLGLACFGYVYARTMASTESPIGLFAALRAYYVSHLGKYVPGKAMVVVLRASLSASQGARPATAALATLYETLVMMASGGFVAAIGFGLAPEPGSRPPMAVSLALGCGFLVLVDPSIFPRLTGLLRAGFPTIGPDACPALSRSFLANALLMAACGWLFLGLSQLAVGHALGIDAAPRSWPLVVAGVALATVVGFVAGLPGGFGVREWVLMVTLAPALGTNRAVVASLGLRLAWVGGEILAASALGLVRPPKPATRPAHP